MFAGILRLIAIGLFGIGVLFVVVSLSSRPSSAPEMEAVG